MPSPQFFYAFVNFDAFVKIASVWFLILLYEIFTGFPSLCGLKDGGCPGATFQNISVVMVSLASVAVAVAFSRLVILREHVRPFAFLSAAANLNIWPTACCCFC